MPSSPIYGSVVAGCIYLPAGPAVEAVVTVSSGSRLWSEETDADFIDQFDKLRAEFGLTAEIVLWSADPNLTVSPTSHWIRADLQRRPSRMETSNA